MHGRRNIVTATKIACVPFVRTHPDNLGFFIINLPAHIQCFVTPSMEQTHRRQSCARKKSLTSRNTFSNFFSNIIQTLEQMCPSRNQVASARASLCKCTLNCIQEPQSVGFHIYNWITFRVNLQQLLLELLEVRG